MVQLATEADVRALWEAGDVDAAASMAIRLYGAEVLGFLRGMLCNAADADDAFSVAAERVWRSFSTFRWESPLRAWIYAIARNEGARQRASAAQSRKRNAPSAEVEQIAAQVRTETAPYLKTESRQGLASLRDALPVEDRALLILRLDRRLSWEDVASVFLDTETSPGPDAIRRESARLRQRFHSLKQQLEATARERGLLTR